MRSTTTRAGCRNGKLGRAVIGILLAAALLLAGPAVATEERASQSTPETLDDLPKLDSADPVSTHKVVLITADSLNPVTVELDPGQLIAWISYSPTRATVVFERDVAKSMICHSRVNFSFEEGELRSAPIHAGEFASFCQLKPGTYRYKIERAQAPDRSAADSDAVLEGEIVVGEK